MDATTKRIARRDWDRMNWYQRQQWMRTYATTHCETPRRSKPEQAILRHLLAHPHATSREIADALGYEGTSPVYQALDRHGHHNAAQRIRENSRVGGGPARKPTAAAARRIAVTREYRDLGRTAHEAATRLNVTLAALARALNRAGEHDLASWVYRAGCSTCPTCGGACSPESTRCWDCYIAAPTERGRRVGTGTPSPHPQPAT